MDEWQHLSVSMPTKSELRAEVAERRKRLTAGANDVRASAVAVNGLELLRAQAPDTRTVAAFMSFGHEPPTDLLVSSLADRGFTVLLPKVVSDTELEWLPYDGMWQADLLGINAPAGQLQPQSLADCGAIFIPATAASADGRRLGRGAGYYDRALAALPTHAQGGPLRIAVIDLAGALPDGVIPMAEHDAWMDAVLVG